MALQKIHSSAKYYNPFMLRVYDFFVLWLSNHFWWRCPTTSVLLPFFKAHVGTDAHLDIGVGTGYYPVHSLDKLRKTQSVCLVDLNPLTLRMAGERLRGAGYKGDLQTLEHDVFAPLPAALNGQFDSVSMFYLFHCLPGAFPKKATDVFANVVPALTPQGTLYGATVLGKGVQHNWIGRYLMKLYNRKGIFGNQNDSEEALREALGEYFQEIDTRVVGPTVLFSAQYPVSGLIRYPFAYTHDHGGQIREKSDS